MQCSENDTFSGTSFTRNYGETGLKCYIQLINEREIFYVKLLKHTFVIVLFSPTHYSVMR